MAEVTGPDEEEENIAEIQRLHGVFESLQEELDSPDLFGKGRGTSGVVDDEDNDGLDSEVNQLPTSSIVKGHKIPSFITKNGNKKLPSSGINLDIPMVKEVNNSNRIPITTTPIATTPIPIKGRKKIDTPMPLASSASSNSTSGSQVRQGQDDEMDNSVTVGTNDIKNPNDSTNNTASITASTITNSSSGTSAATRSKIDMRSRVTARLAEKRSQQQQQPQQQQQQQQQPPPPLQHVPIKPTPEPTPEPKLEPERKEQEKCNSNMEPDDSTVKDIKDDENITNDDDDDDGMNVDTVKAEYTTASNSRHIDSSIQTSHGVATNQDIVPTSENKDNLTKPNGETGDAIYTNNGMNPKSDSSTTTTTTTTTTAAAGTGNIAEQSCDLSLEEVYIDYGDAYSHKDADTEILSMGVDIGSASRRSSTTAAGDNSTAGPFTPAPYVNPLSNSRRTSLNTTTTASYINNNNNNNNGLTKSNSSGGGVGGGVGNASAAASTTAVLTTNPLSALNGLLNTRIKKNQQLSMSYRSYTHDVTTTTTTTSGSGADGAGNEAVAAVLAAVQGGDPTSTKYPANTATATAAEDASVTNPNVNPNLKSADNEETPDKGQFRYATADDNNSDAYKDEIAQLNQKLDLLQLPFIEANNALQDEVQRLQRENEELRMGTLQLPFIESNNNLLSEVATLKHENTELREKIEALRQALDIAHSADNNSHNTNKTAESSISQTQKSISNAATALFAPLQQQSISADRKSSSSSSWW